MAVGNFNNRGFNAAAQIGAEAIVSSTTGTPVEGTETISGVVYDYYIFKGSGSITFSKAGLCDVLIVAGGGGGGKAGSINCGGAGAGGLLQSEYFVNAASYTITVGAGGGEIANGSSSSLGNFLSVAGGGRGAGAVSGVRYQKGNEGGSGGGGLADTDATLYAAGAGQSIQGNNGGAGHNAAGTSAGGGGGGGAGAVGGAGSGSVGGNGGAGSIETIISSTVATAQSVGEVSGTDVYYAGGGGGARESGSFGTGGLGGGGNGRSGVTAATNGSANTGGGAGGTYSTNTAGSGGSGVVIVRVKA